MREDRRSPTPKEPQVTTINLEIDHKPDEEDLNPASKHRKKSPEKTDKDKAKSEEKKKRKVPFTAPSMFRTPERADRRFFVFVGG